MAFGIVELLSVAAKNVDSYNHTFKNLNDDIENGSVFSMGGLYKNTKGVEDGDEVYIAVKPTTATLEKVHYMAASPIRIITTAGDGSQFVDLTVNPKAFKNIAGQPIDGVRLVPGDKVRLNADAIGGTMGSNKLITAVDDSYKLEWASAAGTGLTLELVATRYFSIADNNGFGSQRTVAYDFIVQ